MNFKQQKASSNTSSRAVHVDDLNRRRRSSLMIEQQRPLRFDEGSLQMTNDPSCSIYRRLSKTLEKQLQPNRSITEEEEAEKLKHLEKYGADLLEFMKDKDGRLKEKFDKVFII